LSKTYPEQIIRQVLGCTLGIAAKGIASSKAIARTRSKFCSVPPRMGMTNIIRATLISQVLALKPNSDEA